MRLLANTTNDNILYLIDYQILVNPLLADI